MAIQLTDANIAELSVVFGTFGGKEYAPRNEEARVLSVKGGKKIAKAIETVKAFLMGEPEGIGASAIAICKKAAAIRDAMELEEPQRSEAIAVIVGSEKAGARHSAADQAHIEALQAAHAKAKKAVDSMGDHLSALQPAAKAAEKKPTVNVNVSGAVVSESDLAGYLAGAISEHADKADKKPYGDVAYADPKNGKYPIDTEEHAKAAWSYINQDKNAAEYSADELSAVKDKIRAACEKFGIDISKAAEITQPMENEMTQEEINALVADAATKAAEAAVAKANEAAQVKIDAAKADAEKAKADADAAKAQAEADAQAKLDAANTALEAAKAAEKVAADEAAALKAAAVKTARTPSGGSTQVVAASSSLQAAVKAALAGATSSVL